jgi:hypothetical protein
MSGNRGHDRGPVRVCLRRGHIGTGDRGDAQGTHPGPDRIRPEEAAQFDPAMLESLCRRIGETRAEAEVARALERISTTLSALETLSDVAPPPLLAATLRSMLRDAEMIGMTSLARVAAHVLTCLERADTVGYAATSARLARVGERSMHAVWELDDISV